MRMPEGLEFLTAIEAAECLMIEDQDLYHKLFEIAAEIDEIIYSEGGGEFTHWWFLLDGYEQRQIAEAYEGAI